MFSNKISGSYWNVAKENYSVFPCVNRGPCCVVTEKYLYCKLKGFVCIGFVIFVLLKRFSSNFGGLNLFQIYPQTSLSSKRPWIYRERLEWHNRFEILTVNQNYLMVVRSPDRIGMLRFKKRFGLCLRNRKIVSYINLLCTALGGSPEYSGFQTTYWTMNKKLIDPI